MDKIKVMLYGFLKYKHLLAELVIRDIKVRYRKSFLGLLWTLLNPLLMMTVITVVFSNIFRSNIQNFPVYFLTGNILFAFNSEATTEAMGSIRGNASLIKKVYIPKYLFPLSRVLSGLVNLGFAFVALLIVMIVTRTPFHLTMFLVFIPIVYLILFTTGLSLILSALTVFYRDIAHFYSVVILAWMYLTPIFYPDEIIPAKLRWVLTLNPLHHFMAYFRDLILYNTIPGIETNLSCFLIGVVFLTVGLYVFYKKQDKFILFI